MPNFGASWTEIAAEIVRIDTNIDTWIWIPKNGITSGSSDLTTDFKSGYLL